MLRIRRIYSSFLQEETVRQVQEIFRANFPAVASYADKIPSLLDQPFDAGYRTILLVANRGHGRVGGFSLAIYFPEIKSCFLDFMAVATGTGGGGIGGALFDATRELCRSLKARGLYLECLPADPKAVPDPRARAENRRRLRFYARYGARPIEGTAYETPIDEDPAPHLLFDPLDRKTPLGKGEARAAVRLILERKYGHIVDKTYIRNVVDSFQDDPVRVRAPRSGQTPAPPSASVSRLEKPFSLITTRNHVLHHVTDRGYVERPVRADILNEAAMRTGLFQEIKPRHASESAIRAVHDADFVTFLKTVCEKLNNKRPVYPYVFPIRRPDRRPKELAVRAGYYCIDTFTPLNHNAYEAARSAVDAALTGAETLLAGHRFVYSICRPPGHHAERRVFGGFCYFNNAATAAHFLSKHGKVAVLDIDFHHGNGTQDIFYHRSDVLTQSIHGHPNFAYPYFSGFADERGAGEGSGFNHNYPLPEKADQDRYLPVLEKALARIERFHPAFCVVSLGFDIMKGDPTGDFLLGPSALEQIGRLVGEVRRPLLVVQEGGYSLGNLRRGVRSFFTGLAHHLL